MVSEDRFQDAVYAWLRHSFVRVESEIYLKGTGHFVDFIAYTPFESYAIEVEDSWGSIQSGIGQALLYAAETGHEPVVVLPAEEIDPDELPLVEQIDVRFVSV